MLRTDQDPRFFHRRCSARPGGCLCRADRPDPTWRTALSFGEQSTADQRFAASRSSFAHLVLELGVETIVNVAVGDFGALALIAPASSGGGDVAPLRTCSSSRPKLRPGARTSS